HTVNGVSKLHGQIITSQIFAPFARLEPGKFQVVTNGVTPRRWLGLANPPLTELITNAIGDNWLRNLEELRHLEDQVGDAPFGQEWRRVKHRNKVALIQFL